MRALLLLLLTLALAGCAGSAPTPGASLELEALASPAPSLETPDDTDQEPSVAPDAGEDPEALVDPEQAAVPDWTPLPLRPSECPTWAGDGRLMRTRDLFIPYFGIHFEPDGRAVYTGDNASCYRGEITFVGYLLAAPRVPVHQLRAMRPAWLWDPLPRLLLAQDETNASDDDPPTCREEIDEGGVICLQLTLPEGSTIPTRPVGRWVHVRGHFGDPAAETCRFVGESGLEGEPLPSRAPVAYAIGYCRQRFVVSAIEDAPAP